MTLYDLELEYLECGCKDKEERIMRKLYKEYEQVMGW